MCSRAASTASATTACSPGLPAPTISPEPASCSPCRSHKAMPPTPPQVSNLRRPRILAPAVAAACSSSRPSSAAAHHARIPHHQSRSESTRHDHLQRWQYPPLVRRLSTRQGRARPNHPALFNSTADPTSRATRSATQFNNYASPQQSSASANTSQPPNCRRQISQIPIAAAPQTFPHRGFLPWRLSDAGRHTTWHRTRHGRNPKLCTNSDYLRCSKVATTSPSSRTSHTG